MEHLQHFGLNQDPFRNEPDLRFFFESACHVDAMRRIDRAVRQSKGLTLLEGGSGAGKTLLTRRLYENLEEEVFEAVLMVMLPGAADAQSVLSRFAKQLGVDEPATDRAALIGQLYEHLAIVREDGRHAVLMIDDAHILSAQALAEIGGLLNLEYEDRGLLSLVLVGSEDLEQRLQGDSALHHRVDVRVRLQALDLSNTTAYLYHRLAIAGGQANLVPPAAAETILKFSRGRPRIINTLVDNALFEAFLAGRGSIDPGDVERAAADLAIGADPGSTHTNLGPALAPPAELANAFEQPIPPPQPSASLDAVVPAAAQQAATAEQTTVISSGTDLDAFVSPPAASPATPAGGPSAEAELTTLMDAQFGSPADGDPAMDLDPLPAFGADNKSASMNAEATQIVLSDEPEFETADQPAVQDLDDLFVELIEE